MTNIVRLMQINPQASGTNVDSPKQLNNATAEYDGSGPGEITFWSYTLPGGTLGTSNMVHCKALLKFTNADTSAKSFVIKLYYATAYITLTVSIPASTTYYEWVEGWVIEKSSTSVQTLFATLGPTVQDTNCANVAMDSTVNQPTKLTIILPDFLTSIVCYDAMCEFVQGSL